MRKIFGVLLAWLLVLSLVGSGWGQVSITPSRSLAPYLKLGRTTPGTTTDTLYNPSGILTYNGSAVILSGGTASSSTLWGAYATIAGPTQARIYTFPDSAATMLYSGGALGTPSGGTLTNCTFPTLNQDTSGTAANLSGTPALPNGTTATTQANYDNSTKLATTAYVDAKVGLVLPLANLDFSPADGVTYYFGYAPRMGWGTTATEEYVKIYIPKAGRITKVVLCVANGGTVGTAETSTVSLRLNNTSDTLISNVVKTDAATGYTYTAAISVDVVANDYVQIKWVAASWVTNPTNMRISGYIYME